MKTIKYHTVDKSNWGAGPWDNEPDKIQFQDEATKLPCLIVRSGASGSLCGYVGVSAGHPLYQKDYSEADSKVDHVHGGLTFAGHCQERPQQDGICHLPEAGEDDLIWWLGFDCSHFMDLSPARNARYPDDLFFDDEEYRTVDYLKEEVRQLARQLKAMDPK